MDTLSFLKLVLPPAPAYFVQLLAFPNGPDGDSKNGGSYKLPTLEHVAALAAREADKGWDVYTSMAGFRADATGHYAAHLAEPSHQAHWIDLDCGAGKPYPTIKDGLDALAKFLHAHPRIPMPLLVVSGNGIHAYWPYTTTLTTAVWKQRAWTLRQIMEHAGLQIDGKCSIDPVRLLRPTMTWNRKDPNDPKLVRTYSVRQSAYQPLDAMAVYDALEAYRYQYNISLHVESEQSNGKVSYDSDLAAGLRESYSFNAVADSCLIADWHRKNGGSPLKPGYPGMHNATWMAVAAIYKFSDEGEALFHTHAQQYQWGTARYSKREATKMLGRIDHSGPHCSSLANTNIERWICGQCKHRAGTTSPVTLGTQRAVIMLKQVPADPPPQPVIVAEQNELAMPAGDAPMFSTATPVAVPLFLINGMYRHTPRGVCFVVKTELGDKLSAPFLSHYVMSAKRLKETDGITQYRFEFNTDDPAVQPDARRQSITLTADQIGKQSGDVNATLLNHQIVPKQTGKTNHVMGYLHEWVQQTLTEDVDVLACQMGYQEDGSFVIGRQRFKQGQATEIYLSRVLDDVAASYSTRGTLAGWQAAARTMCEGSTMRHMQALLGLAIAFGAPLMRFTDQQGALISFCTGESGRGKTTTGNLMNSVWGSPKRLLGNAQGDSAAHVYNHLARANTLPVLLDEATSTEPEKIATLLSMLANGNAPGRANADGTNRRTLSWRTLGVTSTNHQISGKLSQRRTEGAGEQARLLEFMFDQSPMFQDPQVHIAIQQFSEEHYGVAGPVYAQMLTRDEEVLKATMEKRLTLMRANWQRDPRERMWIAAMCALMTGLAAATAAKIINWRVDFAAFQQYLFDQLQLMRKAYAERHQPAMVQLTHILNTIMQKHGITVTPATQAAGNVERLDVSESMRMPTEIYARHDTIEGTLSVSTLTFKDFAKENANILIQEAERGGYMQGKRPVRLGAKIMELAGREIRLNCYVFDYRKLLSEHLPVESATVAQLKPAG